jgi:hypothetical protein
MSLDSKVAAGTPRLGQQVLLNDYNEKNFISKKM